MPINNILGVEVDYTQVSATIYDKPFFFEYSGLKGYEVDFPESFEDKDSAVSALHAAADLLEALPDPS